jgi:hypothetical protein
MACCTERRRRRLLPALVAAGLLAQGCATGALFEAGRRTESVLSYQVAFTDGDRLWLVYETETSNRQGERVARGSRTAVIALDDLDPARGHPLDAFPLEYKPGVASSTEELRPIRVRTSVDPAAPLEEGPLLLVEETDGRATGFSLSALPGQPANAHFDSGSLLERKSAPWVYPLLPLAVACDAVVVPATSAFAIPFFVIGD